MEEKAEKRFVLQLHWWGKARHHDLRFLKGKTAIGLTLFRINPISSINSGKKFLCDWKDYHDPKWMDFEGEIPPGEDTEGNPSKNYTAHMKILDKGSYDILERKKEFTRFKINGKLMDGEYVVRQVEIKGEKKWLFWKAKEKKEEEKSIESDELDTILLEAKTADDGTQTQEPWVLTLEDLNKLPDDAFALKAEDGRRFLPHHNFDGDTRMDVLKSQIGRLNGERGFFDDLKPEERKEAYEHLVEHLKEAGEKDIPELVEVKEEKGFVQKAIDKVKEAVLKTKQEKENKDAPTEFDKVRNEAEARRALYTIMDTLDRTLFNIMQSENTKEQKAELSKKAFADAGDAWAEVVMVIAEKGFKAADMELRIGAKISKARLRKLKDALDLLAEIMKEAEAEIQSEQKKDIKIGVLEWKNL